MLYCPKCSQSYEAGRQRFCTNDNSRLVPATGSGNQSKNVFTSILNRHPADGERSKMFAEMPVFGGEQIQVKVSTSPLPKDEPHDYLPAIVDSDEILELGITPLISEKPAAALLEIDEPSVPPAVMENRATLLSDEETHTRENSELSKKETITPQNAEIYCEPELFSIPRPLDTFHIVQEKSSTTTAANDQAIILPERKAESDNSETKDHMAQMTEELPWEKRSPEPVKPLNGWRLGTIALGIIILCGLVWGIWSYFLHRLEKNTDVSNKAEITAQNSGQLSENNVAEKTTSISLVEAPPLSRTIEPPPDTTRFDNTKSDLKGDLARNFRGFSLYYPQDWVKNTSQTNFLDAGRVGATGTPIEQILVSYYDSKGTLAADEGNFSKLVEKSNNDLKAIISDYQVVSQGETTINNGWKAYEVKFQGSGKTVNGDKITLWGRRLWIPPARLDTKTGFRITLLATSNSPEVRSADDVGFKGELANVMRTFEPAPLDTSY